MKNDKTYIKKAPEKVQQDVNKKEPKILKNLNIYLNNTNLILPINNLPKIEVNALDDIVLKTEQTLQSLNIDLVFDKNNYSAFVPTSLDHRTSKQLAKENYPQDFELEASSNTPLTDLFIPEMFKKRNIDDKQNTEITEAQVVYWHNYKGKIRNDSDVFQDLKTDLGTYFGDDETGVITWSLEESLAKINEIIAKMDEFGTKPLKNKINPNVLAMLKDDPAWLLIYLSNITEPDFIWNELNEEEADNLLNTATTDISVLISFVIVYVSCFMTKTKDSKILDDVYNKFASQSNLYNYFSLREITQSSFMYVDEVSLLKKKFDKASLQEFIIQHSSIPTLFTIDNLESEAKATIFKALLEKTNEFNTISATDYNYNVLKNLFTVYNNFLKNNNFSLTDYYNTIPSFENNLTNILKDIANYQYTSYKAPTNKETVKKGTSNNAKR